MSYRVNVIIEKDHHGYYAYCPDLEGCQTQGDNFEEVMDHIKEAIDLYIETLSKDERSSYLGREVFTTSVEVDVA